MAGGQERILRGRIRSIQATKKITRAMELIAASRIVKAQQRVAAAVPYSEKITDVVRDLAAAGAGLDAPLLAGHDQVSTTCYVAITADRGLCGGYNAGVQRATEGEVKADVVAGRAVPHRARRAQGLRLLPLPRLPARRDVRRVLRHAEAGGRQAHRHLRDRAVHHRCGRRGRARVHPLRVGRQPGGRAAPARAARRRDGAGGDGRARTGRGARRATTSTSPIPRRSSTPCCRATSRPASTPPCSTPRRRSTPSASGR